VGYQNPIQFRRQRKHFGIGKSFQIGLVRRHEIQCRFVATAFFYDGVIESASARKRIIRQSRRDATCLSMRPNFSWMSGGAGWAVV
jgi:anthranilate/para-aminobenzoate synthase component I